MEPNASTIPMAMSASAPQVSRVFRAPGLEVACNLNTYEVAKETSALFSFVLWNTACLLQSLGSTPLWQKIVFKYRKPFPCGSNKFTVYGSSDLPLSAPSLASQKVTTSSVLTRESMSGRTAVWSLLPVAYLSFFPVRLYSTQLKNKRWTEQYRCVFWFLLRQAIFYQKWKTEMW